MLLYHASKRSKNKHSLCWAIRPSRTDIWANYQSADKCGKSGDINERCHKHATQSPYDSAAWSSKCWRKNCWPWRSSKTNPCYYVDVTRRNKWWRSFPNQSSFRFRSHDINDLPPHTSETQCPSQHKENWIKHQGHPEKSGTASGHGRLLCHEQRCQNNNQSSSFHKHRGWYAYSISGPSKVQCCTCQFLIWSSHLNRESRCSGKNQTWFQGRSQHWPKPQSHEDSKHNVNWS